MEIGSEGVIFTVILFVKYHELQKNALVSSGVRRRTSLKSAGGEPVSRDGLIKKKSRNWADRPHSLFQKWPLSSNEQVKDSI